MGTRNFWGRPPVVDSKVLIILAPCLGLAVNALTHIGLMRLFGIGMLKGLFASFFCGLTCTVLVTLLAAPFDDGSIWNTASNMTIFILLGYCYFHFVNLGATARRFRIMHELSQAPDGMTLDDIKTMYGSAEMVEHRIRRLTSNGQVSCLNEVYRLKPSLIMTIATCFSLGKRLLFGRAKAHERTEGA